MSPITFNPTTTAAFFILFTSLTPYLLYHLASHHFNWTDNRAKSPVVHAQDLCKLAGFGAAICLVGGYVETFSPLVTAIMAHITIVLYAFLCEWEPMRTDLSRWRSWPWQMWAVFLAAVTLIVLFTLYHIAVAIERWGFVGACLYLGTFVCSIVGVGMGTVGIARWQNHGGLRGVGRVKVEIMDDGDTEEGEEEESRPIRGATMRRYSGLDNEASEEEETERKSRWPHVKIHVHHWQIFGFLALFTRFDTWPSQLAAGIVLGCYVHGIAAYGYDSIWILEEVQER
ncbi:hypothetical protein SAICODRAFT_29703 [Saitoella complicata NRRL Y-17804]|uniref:Uncharacterized protein n=1 Tax=Saitoella complicata (strain BCRC 22490 / CBS 7301 / JCM 7358 / NBRC 10748 / NRRL Y-17804) TaxID=698492 RepID=A0A0E9NH39_SAICN|nr:uncharacterized protein SAICODRAFT_29703 [Saitoella complicata NRRL Y-17804]ODQ54129.1 hypothetical protein SAICODRAFT_29703 [Saitoella complicata NRRL Y-17804]GAO49202.1 hypothetical protein G7K_3360-t1 [Saitoella complicata NRRL Y-17804]